MSEFNPALEEALFEAAVAKPSAEERATFVEAVCRDNPVLRARLEVLLEGHFQAQGFLGGEAKKPLEKPAPPPTEDGSTFIGRYKLLEKLGEGGFGEVWMAEQKEPVKRRVALKIIKLGMDTKQVVARFEAERQALALMEHPNIAKVFDAGATDTGRPYFVMELVRGERITEFCDKNQVTAPERLNLFIQVCRAIQHAHQKGIIHRDIKPSNILVTLHDGVPVPKIIDFGIAKATQQELTEKTVFTQFRQFLGTPAYISPEQAEMSGLDIDTRSDIYSLGVLLYELLTGLTPFDTQELLKAGLEGLRKAIRENQPLRPSTRLSGMTKDELTTTAKRRGAEAPKLISLVRGDLDWIVMKCLEKDRSRRYETANGLARDVERFLHHEPIVARPPSRVYEFQKTVRRHWLGFAAVAAVLVVLAAGVLVSTLEAFRARKAEADQAKQKAAAQQILYKSLLGEARSARQARRVGYRDLVFALLKQAKGLDVPEKNAADLREEAVSCLGDFVGLTPAAFTDFPTNVVSASLDGSGHYAAFRLSERTLQLRQMPSGKQLASVTFTNGVIQDFCFGSARDQLFVLRRDPWKIHVLSSEPSGRWQETEERTIPIGSLKLIHSGTNVFAVNVKGVNPASRTEIWDYPGNFGFGIRFGEPFPQDDASLYMRIRLLDLHTGAYVSDYELTNALCRDCTMSFAANGDGQVLEVKTWDNRDPYTSALVNLYNWKTGERMNQLHLTNNGPLSLSDNGKHLASLSELGANIYTVPRLEPIVQLKGNFFTDPAIISGNTLALARPSQNRIRLLNLLTKEDVALLDEPDSAAPVAFTADGHSLLTLGPNHTRLYRLDTPEKLDLPLHGTTVNGAAFSPDGLRLASVAQDGLVRVCDAITGRTAWETNDLPGGGVFINYSPDAQWLVVGDASTDRAWIRDAHTGEPLLEVGTNRAGGAASVQVSPNGRYLATSGLATEGINIRAIESVNPDARNPHLQARLLKSAGPGLSLVFAPDSRSVAFAGVAGVVATGPSSGEELYVWDFERSAEPRRLGPRIIGGSECLDFTPDGAHLLAMNTRGEIVTLDAATGNLVSSFFAEAPELVQETLLFRLSPNGSKLAMSVSTPSGVGVSIWDPKAGKRLYTLPPEAGGVSSLAWSPDNRRLAVARESGGISIWDLEAVNQILTQLALKPSD